MRWQQVLGILLGVLVVGPFLAALTGGAGSIEILLSALIAAVVGYFVSSRFVPASVR